MAGAAVNRNSILHVPVTPPHDVKTLQLINKTLESVLEHGPEFEALLMTRAEVQREEKWAWLWDARSVGGVWYRWRLWEIVTGSSSSGSKGRYLPLFDGSHAWKAPEKKLPFEYTTHIDEFISDSEYNSSDEEDMDGEANREVNAGAEVENTFLNPLDKAKLTHLLSRLPTTLSRIRKGDIARITAFALTHASRGADEAVAMIAANINKPLALTAANPALQHFEGALKDAKVFEKLGLMADKLRWGRLKADKWKRSGLKKGKWKVVEASTLAGVDTLPEAVVKADDGDVEGEPMEEDDVTGEPMEDYDVAGEPMDDEDVAGEPMDEEDVEGEPMEDDVEGEPMEDDVDGEKRDTAALEASSQAGGNAQVIPAGTGPGRKRMRAVDMFAESGDSD
ncbi:U2 snRNP-associated SURP motif-containing protein like [Verticillium longisporum]|nr:U2 snRNP-associated SURP motif-containing protein like [Verticillium longisporum]